MPVTIPTHKATQQSDCGILLKTISPGSFQEPVQYAHRDDYYIFGIVENGHCCISIDFKNYTVSDHEILCVQPGQVHRVVDTGNAQATILFIDSVFIDAPDKQILSEYALSVAPFRINDLQFNELEQIFSIISRNINIPESSRTKRIVQDLSRAATGIIIDNIQNIICRQLKSRRQIEITLALKKLLSEDSHINRRPSYYAQLLHISPVYLNEVVKNITGTTASKHSRRNHIESQTYANLYHLEHKRDSFQSRVRRPYLFHPSIHSNSRFIPHYIQKKIPRIIQSLPHIVYFPVSL